MSGPYPQFHTPLSSSCPFRQLAGYGGIALPELKKLDESCHDVGMTWPDDVTFAAFATVVVTAGAAVVVVAVVTMGAAVVVVAAIVVVVVTTVAGFGVVAVAFAVVDVVAVLDADALPAGA
jgi:hypothetical protein